MADNEKDTSLFEPVDVSEPRAPRKEIEIIEEALAFRRRNWIKTHMVYIYAVIGLIFVVLVGFVIYFVYQNSNPMSRFVHAASKNFGTSFDYEIEVTEEGLPVMSYTGSVSVDRSGHAVQAVYNADYNSYTYSGAVIADARTAVKGNFYDNQWAVYDCTDNVQDFFDFDKDFRNGKFDGGAFLRFTGLTSNFSTRELEKFSGTLIKRLSTDSSIAEITSEKVENGTHYHYDINFYELYEMVKNDGASVFYRASDYDRFVSSFGENEDIIKNAVFTIDFVVDRSGYLTSFDMTVITSGREYGFSCTMSNFGTATVELPKAFLKAAATLPAKKK